MKTNETQWKHRKTNEIQKKTINLHGEGFPPPPPVGLGVVMSSRKFKKEEDQTNFHNTRTKLSEQDEWEFPHPPLWEWAVGEGWGGQDRKSLKIIGKVRENHCRVESSPPPPLWVWVWVWATSYAHLPVRVRIPLVLLPLSLASAVASAVSSCSYILPLSVPRVTNLKMTGKQFKWKEIKGKHGKPL